MDFESRGTNLWPDADLELRSVGDGFSFEGYALVWDAWSEPIPYGPQGDFRETFRAGSLERTLGRKPDVVLSTQHDLMTIPLGRTTAGTFNLESDSHGLLTKGELPDNELGRPVRDAIKRKDLKGMSIRFRVPNEKTGARWTDSFKKREILEAQLGPEISLVSFPAYTSTTATVRQMAEQLAADLGDVEPDDLAKAFEVLRTDDGRLNPEQHALLEKAIAAKADAPFVPPILAKARERLAAFASKQ